MRASWERRNEWFAKTFKPLQPPCQHQTTKLQLAEGERRIVCVDCGRIVSSRKTAV